MNCRLFSQHENYTTESQIVKLIYDTDKYYKIKVKLFCSAFLMFHQHSFIQVSLSPGYIIYIYI